MPLKIKDPVSALTHFIAMILALCAASRSSSRQRRSPAAATCWLLPFYYQHGAALRGQHRLPYAGHLTEDKPHAAQGGPHDDFHSDCRDLHSGLYAGSGRPHRLAPSGAGMGHCRCRHSHKRAVDHLPQMVSS